MCFVGFRCFCLICLRNQSFIKKQKPSRLHTSGLEASPAFRRSSIAESPAGVRAESSEGCRGHTAEHYPKELKRIIQDMPEPTQTSQWYVQQVCGKAGGLHKESSGLSNCSPVQVQDMRPGSNVRQLPVYSHVSDIIDRLNASRAQICPPRHGNTLAAEIRRMQNGLPKAEGQGTKLSLFLRQGSACDQRGKLRGLPAAQVAVTATSGPLELHFFPRLDWEGPPNRRTTQKKILRPFEAPPWACDAWLEGCSPVLSQSEQTRISAPLPKSACWLQASISVMMTCLVSFFLAKSADPLKWNHLYCSCCCCRCCQPQIFAHEAPHSP